MTDDDFAWIDAAAARALAIGSRPNTFVHCDYKLNNLTVMQSGDDWRVSGLFDLHEAQFGDGARDVARQTCGYLDTDPELAAYSSIAICGMSAATRTSGNCCRST